MDAITGHFWFWPTIIIVCTIGAILVAVRIVVRGYQLTGSMTKTKRGTRFYLAWMFILFGLGLGLLSDQPWYVPMLVGAWFGLNAALVPQEVTYGKAFMYLAQLGGTAAVLFLILLLVN
jgi:hypothetical protein